MSSQFESLNQQSVVVEHAERVLIVMAMESEAAPLRDALGAEPLDSPAWAASLPCRFALAPRTAGRPETVIAVNGIDPIYGVDAVGSTAAALTAHVGLNLGRPAPDLVLSAAGGVSTLRSARCISGGLISLAMTAGSRFRASTPWVNAGLLRQTCGAMQPRSVAGSE